MFITAWKQSFDVGERTISLRAKRDDLERMRNDLTVDLEASAIGNCGRYYN